MEKYIYLTREQAVAVYSVQARNSGFSIECSLTDTECFEASFLKWCKHNLIKIK